MSPYRSIALALLLLIVPGVASAQLETLAGLSGMPATPPMPPASAMPAAPDMPALSGAPALPGDSTSMGNFTLHIDGLDGPQQVSTALKIVAMLTILTLAPAILIMLTSFTRVVIVLAFVKRALSLTEAPPQQVVVGLALFLTFFIMAPTWNKINDEALQPYLRQEIDEKAAYRAAETHVRGFLLAHTRETDLATMYGMSRLPTPETLADVPTYVIVPAFLLSELKTAFTIGFVIFIPFLILDMVVASVLLSMGMMMLPPVIVSLPFKIILFVLVDGWNLIVGELVKSFNT